MKKEYRLKGAFIANIFIIIFEIIALILSIVNQGIENFQFYTQDSNYFAMLVSILFCVFAVKELRGNGEIPEWIHTMRYISVSCLMVTFFVVLFVLMPMMQENALLMLYNGSMLYQHTLCPVLAIGSFLLFEVKNKLPKSVIIKALIPTLIYAVIAIVLNILRIMEGPYPFLLVYAQPWYMSVLWCIIILGIAGILAFTVWWIHNLIWKRTKRR